MSFARTGVIFAEELARTFRRPLFWFLIGLLAFMSWGLASGNMTISSGDSSVGGDAFVEQWFHRVVVPEYRLSDARLVVDPDVQVLQLRRKAAVARL